MDPKLVFFFVVVTVIVLIPALALTARFALKPIAESILNILKAFAEHDAALLGNASVEQLEKKVAALEREVEIIKSERDFDRALSAGAQKQLDKPR